jgi:NADH:ubiquinone oxidoreductase subunit
MCTKISLLSWWRGRYVGADDFGNKYYEEKNKQNKKPRRWVIYHGIPEASTVPPAWHSWLHYIAKEAPQSTQDNKLPWQKEHIPNMTGTPLSYKPEKQFSPLSFHYEAWDPQSVA